MLRTIHISHSVSGTSNIKGEWQSQTSKSYPLSYQPESSTHTHLQYSDRGPDDLGMSLKQSKFYIMEAEREKNGSGCEVTRYVFLQ